MPVIMKTRQNANISPITSKMGFVLVGFRSDGPTPFTLCTSTTVNHAERGLTEFMAEILKHYYSNLSASVSNKSIYRKTCHLLFLCTLQNFLVTNHFCSSDISSEKRPNRSNRCIDTQGIDCANLVHYKVTMIYENLLFTMNGSEIKKKKRIISKL